MRQRKSASRRGRARWSARRKAEAVLRMLGGGDPERLSKGLGVPRAELEQWRDTFCRGGEQALKSRQDCATRLRRAQRRIERLAMELEIYRERLSARSHVDEVRSWIGRKSPTNGKPYPIVMLCRIFEVPRSSLYRVAAEQWGHGSESSPAGGSARSAFSRPLRTPLEQGEN